MKESAVQFGKSVKLTGVMTHPETFRDDLPAVIFFNSGVRHHVGCCRMSVRIARELAGKGFLCLRFDLSGIGDSLLRPDGLQYEKSSIEDAKEALEYLARTQGVKQFVFYGLCSGAHLGFKLAQQDPRVVGLIQVDGYLYKTRGFMIRHYLPRLFNLGVWMRFVMTRLKGKGGRTDAGSADGQDLKNSEVLVQQWPETPPRDVVQAGYRTLLDRSVEFLVYVTGDQEYVYNYEKQFYDMFPGLNFANRLAVYFLPKASHILAEKDGQDVVLDRTVAWVSQKFQNASA